MINISNIKTKSKNKKLTWKYNYKVINKAHSYFKELFKINSLNKIKITIV